MVTLHDAKLIMDNYEAINTEAVKINAANVLMMKHKSFAGVAKQYTCDGDILKNQMIDIYLRMLNVSISKITDEQDLFTINMLGITYDTNQEDLRVLDVGPNS